jgi:hypothetical protein
MSTHHDLTSVSTAAMGARANDPAKSIIHNQNNVLHVKLRDNRFQDNLLTKKLRQLNLEEMKTRLKHQRSSNELMLFLNECQKTTGYYAKMKNRFNIATNQAWVKLFCFL